MPIFIDLEASALENGYPIEVGWVAVDEDNRTLGEFVGHARSKQKAPGVRERRPGAGKDRRSLLPPAGNLRLHSAAPPVNRLPSGVERSAGDEGSVAGLATWHPIVARTYRRTAVAGME